MVVSSLFPGQKQNNVETNIENACFIICVYTLRKPSLETGPKDSKASLLCLNTNFISRKKRVICMLRLCAFQVKQPRFQACLVLVRVNAHYLLNCVTRRNIRKPYRGKYIQKSNLFILKRDLVDIF